MQATLDEQQTAIQTEYDTAQQNMVEALAANESSNLAEDLKMASEKMAETERFVAECEIEANTAREEAEIKKQAHEDCK